MVLIVALIFLLLLTIMAISATGRSLLQERIVGGLASAQAAEWMAETAIRGTEWRLYNNTGAGLACYDSSQPGNINSKVTTFRTSTDYTIAKNSGAGTVYQGAGGSTDYTQAANGGLAANALVLLEYLGTDRAPDASSSHAAESGSSGAGTTPYYIYRVTARALGTNPNTVRTLETTFVTPSQVSCVAS
ncbi:MAG: PilX N-terminal domain-containing pilus assembly protein [Dyella sp.]